MNGLAFGLMIAASAAAGTSGSGWISGDTLTTVLTILFGAGGVVSGKMWGDHSAKKHEDELRAKITNELRAKITNDPLHVQQINDCVPVKVCDRRMDALDDRVTRLEQKVDDGFEKIMDKLSALDNRSEGRANALYRRLDSIIDNRAK